MSPSTGRPGGRPGTGQGTGRPTRPVAGRPATGRHGAGAGRPVAGRSGTGRPGAERAPERAPVRAREADHEGDAETERHYAAAWRLPAPATGVDDPDDREDEPAVTETVVTRDEAGPDVADGSERSDGSDGDAGWLLGDDRRASDDDHDDAITELLGHDDPPRRDGRRWLWPGIAALLVLALAGGVFFARDLLGVVFPPDYDGPGTGRVVVEVADGASTREIGDDLARADVVASARAFGDAAEDDPDGRGIQPGFYQLRRQMAAAGAVDALLDPANRVGRLEIRSGVQLDDTVGAGDATVPGVLSMISRSTCTVDESGAEQCASVDDLRAAMADTDPAELGVPSWALAGVRRAEPNRRLEGLLAPGTYDLAPGTAAREALAQVVRASVPRLEAGGLVREAQARGVDPYDALIIASLAEREGVPADFGKVAQVIVNRLAVPMRLQFDSTVNYPLDRQTLLTSPYDRARPGPYNTYLNLGLTPTPIGAVSPDALAAALEPTPGPWVYFVKCENSGLSCFAVTPEEHDANRRLAQTRGVY
ncbi:endolytic transglycosylase MltG [Actinomycetospora sp. CA-101289]|uniref:endolytic transglycosylase MltG n=1 Tax=Actinomycetospora sp. CA-101289 TaxID=3239893 RepID=UPI003D96AE9F